MKMIQSEEHKGKNRGDMAWDVGAWSRKKAEGSTRERGIVKVVKPEQGNDGADVFRKE